MVLDVLVLDLETGAVEKLIAGRSGRGFISD
jgi:hypothetical protein